MQEASYTYLKRWLSRNEIKKIREGENPLGITLTRQQVWKIMTDKSNNHEFRNILIQRARLNEAIYTGKSSL